MHKWILHSGLIQLTWDGSLYIPLIYEGSQVVINKQNFISFSNDHFGPSIDHIDRH